MVDSTNLPEVDINAIATDLNNKMDKDGVNASCPTLLSRTANSNGGVTEIWSDGYCVQTGITPSGSTGTITLSQAYKDTSYLFFANICHERNTNTLYTLQINTRTSSSFNFRKVYGIANDVGLAGEDFNWKVEGYIR